MPLSTRLPEEFQKTFRPRERSQIIRIDFDPGVRPPPTYTKVRISAPGLFGALFDG